MHKRRWWVIATLVAGCGAVPPESTGTSATPEPTPQPEAARAADTPSASPAPPPEIAPPGRWRAVHVAGASVASSGPAPAATDGQPQTEWNPREKIGPGAPQWLAVPLARAAAGRLAVLWHGHGMHYQQYGYGMPRSYDLEVSADSSDGADGTWRTVERVTDNRVRSRLAIVDAPGARWVRLTFRQVWSDVQREPFLREVEVYEAVEPGEPDTWLIMGDSVMAVTFEPLQANQFSAMVEARHPGHRPMLIGGAVGGDRAEHAVERLAIALPTLPRGTVVGLVYGANDASNGIPVEAYRRHMQATIDLLRAHGMIPLLATAPWTLNPRMADYAEVVKELETLNGLPPGPDFYTHFRDHPEALSTDRVHPNAQGIRTIHRMWAEAADFRYAR